MKSPNRLNTSWSSFVQSEQELKKCFRDLNERPNVICIQEMGLKPHLDFVLKGKRYDPGEGRRGRLCDFDQRRNILWTEKNG